MRSCRPTALLLFLATVLASGLAWAGANLWTSNGPANRGEIRALAYVPGSTPAILVQRWPSLAARSTDDGATWTPLVGIPVGVGSVVISFAFAPSDPRIVFAVWNNVHTGDREIYKSTDGGASWIAVGGGPSAPVNLCWPRRIAVAPSDATKVFAATSDGVYRSTDGGATWLRSTNYVSALANSPAVDPTNPSIVYQGRTAGAVQVLKSVDGGATWSPAGAGIAAPVRDLAIDAANPLNVYAWTSAGAYKSTDGGGSWGLASTGLPAGVLAPNSLYNSSVYFPPDAPSTLLALTSMGLYTTTDGAASWTHLGPSFPPKRLIAFSGPLSNLFLGSYAGLLRSTDGGATFAPVPAITAGAFAPTWEIHGDPLSTSTFFVSTMSGFYMTTDDGMTWTDQIANLPSSDVSSLFILPKVPNVWLVATSSGWLRSTDFGTTWNPSGTGGVRLVADPFLSDVIYGLGAPGVVVSTDQGQTWTTYTSGLSAVGLQAVVPDPTTAGVVFAATGEGGLYMSTDGGQTWAASATYPTGTYCNYIAVNPFDSQVIYAASWDYLGGGADVYKSTNRGATWSPIVISGVLGSYINVIVADPLTPGTLYLATDSTGLWVTTDAGATWAPVNDGLPAGTSAQWFELHPADPKKYLLATWDTGGGWSYTSNPTGSLVAGGGGFEQAAALGTWTETGTATVEFSPLSTTPGGGSALVTVGTNAAPVAPRWMAHAASNGTGDGIQQACSPVDAGYTYSLGGKILIPSGQAQTGSGRVVMSWYSDAACTAFLSATETPAVSGAPFDVWRDSSLTGVRPPAGAVRGRIGLFVTVDQPRGLFSVNFDDVAFTATCDGATAVVSGGGAIPVGGSTTIQAVLTGLGPWTVTWSDGVVQTTPVSPLVRTASPAYSQRYFVTSASDAYCTGLASGYASVDVEAPVPALGEPALAALTLLLVLAGAWVLSRTR
jgi:photosystem II stability/assembly factor-like uncharacterized protein